MRHVVLLALLLPLAALGDDTKGLWRQTEYKEDETGKRTPCELGFCPPVQWGVLVKQGLNTICAPAPALQDWAHQHLEQITTLLRGRFHNCKDTVDGASCDEGRISWNFAIPDATHIEFSYTVEGGGHRMTRQSRFERLGDDCTGAGGELRQRP